MRSTGTPEIRAASGLSPTAYIHCPNCERDSARCAATATVPTTITVRGTPRTSLVAKRVKVAGRPAIEEDGEWKVTYQIAAPARKMRVAKVTMKGGMLSRVTDSPLTAPAPTPTASMAATAAGTARADPPR